MPLPTSSEQESLKSNPKPSLKPGMDVVPAVPRNPRKFSKLVLLTTSKNSTKVVGAKRKGVHCVMSLGVPGPATLARALLKTHPEAERAIEAAPQEPEAKHSKLDLVLEMELKTLHSQGRRGTTELDPRTHIYILDQMNQTQDLALCKAGVPPLSYIPSPLYLFILRVACFAVQKLLNSM